MEFIRVGMDPISCNAGVISDFCWWKCCSSFGGYFLLNWATVHNGLYEFLYAVFFYA